MGWWKLLSAWRSARRSTARTRASSSWAENGFTPKYAPPRAQPPPPPAPHRHTPGQQDQVRLVGGHPFNRLLAVVGHVGLVAGGLQIHLDQPHVARLIVHHQDGSLLRHRAPPLPLWEQVRAPEV